MEKKINIAEILKDCPQGTKLYSPIFGDVYLDKIRQHLAIVVTTDKEQGDFKEEFLYDGRYGMNGECMLFPSKDKTTWEGFQRPFQDGDIIFTCAMFNGICSDYLYTGLYYTWISIFHKMHKDQVITYVDIENSGTYFPFWMRKGELCRKNDISYQRLATEEEKERLFKFIKDNGYKWNVETKTLEKLVEPKFKVGDKIKHKVTGSVYKIMFILLNGDNGGTYEVAVTNEIRSSIDIEVQDNYELVSDEIKPKFKVGDRVKNKNHFAYKYTYSIKSIKSWGYILDDIYETGVGFDKQDEWEIVTDKVDKFDISTLVPFESKVLVRNCESEIWTPAIFGGYINDCLRYYKYIVMGEVIHKCLIPYEGNEHLSCTKKDCDEYYKIWECNSGM